jgi:hypothetical protein
VDTFVIEVRPESELPSAPIVTVRKTALGDDGRLPMLIDWSSGREDGARPRYRLEMRTLGKKRWGKYKPVFGTLTRTGTNRTFTPGTYQLRVRSQPSGGKPGQWVESAPFRIQTLQESDKSIEYRGSWAKQTRKGALGQQVRRSNRPGDSFRVPINGTAVSLVMPSGSNLGVVKVCVDPETPTAACRTIDLSTFRKSARRVVTNLRDLAPGEHVLEVSVIEAPAELDAIVVVTPAPETVAPPASPAPVASPAPGS